MKNLYWTAALALIASSTQAQTYAGKDVCSRAVAENRMNGMSTDQCICVAEIAKQNMSPELYALWTQAMYLGESREQEMNSLRQSQRKTLSQMKKTARLSKKQCGAK